MWGMGRLDSALDFARAARRADPLSAALALREADLLAKTHRLREAVSLYEEVIREMPGDDRAYYGLAEAFRLQGRFDEGIEAVRNGRALIGDELPSGSYRGAEGYARIEREAALGQLEWLRMRALTESYVSPLDWASVYARLDQRELAYEHLERAFAHRSAGLVFLRVEPSWEKLRGDLRFTRYIDRLRFPAAA